MGGEAVPHTAPFLGSRQPLLFAATTCFIPSSLRDEIKRMRKRKGECCFFRRKTVRRGDLEVRHVKRIRTHQRNVTKKTYPVSSDLSPVNQGKRGHRNEVGLPGLYASCPFLATRFESPYWKASWCNGASEAWVQIQPCNWGKFAWCQLFPPMYHGSNSI